MRNSLHSSEASGNDLKDLLISRGSAEEFLWGLSESDESEFSLCLDYDETAFGNFLKPISN